MKNLLNKLFHLEERQASIKTELIGGFFTFIAMCYILPVNSQILSAMGMNTAGVFMATALLSFLVSVIMGLVANYPLVLSAGMGLNAYVAYTLSSGFDSWQQKMILVTICGLLFFILSLTPIRKIIIESIPKPLKLMISAALGAFIFFVGLKGAGIIAPSESTLVTLGNFADPAMSIAIIAVIVTIGLMFSKYELIQKLAVPMGILAAALVGLVLSIILKETGHLIYQDNTWVYQIPGLEGVATTLPIAPWYPETGLKFADFSGLQSVMFYGALDGYTGEQFGKDLLTIFTNPISYVAIFSMIFVNIFDTTAALIVVGGATGAMDEDGKMKNYRRAVIADATGSVICGPLGTSTVTSFVESGVGVSMGAKTGLMAVSAGLMFLLCAFIYPIFSIFTVGSVTAAALVCVGLTIMSNAFKDLDFKDPIIAFSAIMTVLFAILCYSISNGIGFGFITYTTIMVIKHRGKEVSLPIYIISSLFIVSFVLSIFVR